MCDLSTSDETSESQVRARLGDDYANAVLAEANERRVPMKSYLYEGIVRFHVAIMMIARKLWDDYCKAMPVDDTLEQIHHVGFDASPLHGFEG